MYENSKWRKVSPKNGRKMKFIRYGFAKNVPSTCVYSLLSSQSSMNKRFSYKILEQSIHSRETNRWDRRKFVVGNKRFIDFHISFWREDKRESFGDAMTNNMKILKRTNKRKKTMLINKCTGTEYFGYQYNKNMNSKHSEYTACLKLQSIALPIILCTNHLRWVLPCFTLAELGRETFFSAT